MKNNLIKALVLSLEYEMKTYNSRDFSYELESEYGYVTVTITVIASESGCFHGLQSLYALINSNLCSHAMVKGRNLVITVF